MSERSAALLIDDILEAASKIASYTAGMAREDFNCVSCPRNSPLSPELSCGTLHSFPRIFSVL